MDDKVCKIQITSERAAIRRMAGELTEVEPLREISFQRTMSQIHAPGQKHCAHAACPAPVRIVVKTVESEARLALPTDIRIRLSK